MQFQIITNIKSIELYSIKQRFLVYIYNIVTPEYDLGLNFDFPNSEYF